MKKLEILQRFAYKSNKIIDLVSEIILTETADTKWVCTRSTWTAPGVKFFVEKLIKKINTNTFIFAICFSPEWGTCGYFESLYN